MPEPWIVVGLGNPGRAHEGTLHNLGRDVAERLAVKRKVNFAEVAKARVARIDEGYILVPETFMNLSGEAVGPFARKKGIPPARILALVDDVYLATGRVRIRARGTDAGHNGLKSIDAALGTNAYPRVRIGIGPDPGGEFRADYVLSRPRPEVMGEVFSGKELALVATEAVLERGVEEAMNLFNA